jgi:hypothetical protein
MEVAQLKLVDRLNKRIFEQLQALKYKLLWEKVILAKLSIALLLRLIS